MPFGVPKVPYLIPGDDESSWVDLYNRLHRQRLLFLGDKVNVENSNHLVGIMTFLNIEDPTQELFFFINCPGGSVISGIAIFDTVQTIIPDVTTIGMGVAASMGCFILMGGSITKRVALPYARVMIHQPATSFYKDAKDERVIEAEEIHFIREIITDVYVEITCKPRWVIIEDLERNTFMSATEAQAHGIVDLVGI